MAIHIFVKGLWDVHTTTAKIYEKDPQTLSEVMTVVEKSNAAQQLTAILTPSTVSMMSNKDRCFCGHIGHLGGHCPNAWCYKIPPSGTPCHQDRSHSRPRYTHNQRDRLLCKAVPLCLWFNT